MEQINIKIDNDFSCYSAPANRQLANHAKTFLKKVNNAIEKHNDSGKSDYLAATVCNSFEKSMAAYIRSYNRACKTQTGRLGGAGDTAVREVIWWYCCKIGKAVGYSESELDDIWEKHYE